MNRINSKAQEAIRLANEIACRRQATHLGAFHLFAALVEMTTEVPAQALANLGANVDRVREVVNRFYLQAPISLGTGRPVKHLSEDAAVSKVLEYAHDEAYALDLDYVGPEHLLLGLFDVDFPMLGRALELLEIGRLQLRAEVFRLIGRDPKTGLPFNVYLPLDVVARLDKIGDTLHAGGLAETIVTLLDSYQARVGAT